MGAYDARGTGQEILLDWLDLECLRDDGYTSRMTSAVTVRPDLSAPEVYVFRDDCDDAYCSIYIPEGLDLETPTGDKRREITRIQLGSLALNNEEHEILREWNGDSYGDIILTAEYGEI